MKIIAEREGIPAAGRGNLAPPARPSLLKRVSTWLRRRDKRELSLYRAWNTTRQTSLGDNISLATSSAARRRGLLDHSELKAGHGLWLLPCEAVHTFGMRFPIDLVFLDRKQRVRKTRAHVVRRRLSACWRAHSVLELPAGTLARTGTRVGDTVQCERIPAHTSQID